MVAKVISGFKSVSGLMISPETGTRFLNLTHHSVSFYYSNLTLTIHCCVSCGARVVHNLAAALSNVMPVTMSHRICSYVRTWYTTPYAGSTTAQT